MISRMDLEWTWTSAQFKFDASISGIVKQRIVEAGVSPWLPNRWGDVDLLRQE
jgi:hypothetical protein